MRSQWGRYRCQIPNRAGFLLMVVCARLPVVTFHRASGPSTKMGKGGVFGYASRERINNNKKVVQLWYRVPWRGLSHGQQGLFVNVWTVYTTHPTQDSFVHKCFSTLATNYECQVIIYQGPHGAKYNWKYVIMLLVIGLTASANRGYLYMFVLTMKLHRLLYPKSKTSSTPGPCAP